ncbi:MAG: methyltransferase domain-containing protein [Phycisphaerales bacterium]
MSVPAATEACVVCGAATVDAGPSVHGPSPQVAGVPIELGDAAARVRRCPGCDLLFKHPFVSDAQLMDCYRQSPEDNWEHDPDPRKRRFDTLADLVRTHAPGPRVLDVGCSNGALLHHLGAEFERFGLEPSHSAAAVASTRGVGMLGATFDDLEPDALDGGDASAAPPVFDAILAIDVLEHLTDPPAFIAAVARHLRPGGVFIGLTGDHGAWPWRWQGAAYWYAALPEHQVFYGRRTIERLAADHGLAVLEQRRTSHARQSVSRTARDAVRGTLFGLRRRLGLAGNRPGPGWLPAHDHMLFVLRRV